MQNSESGRKLNQAVNTTSRAVGGAISTAKGAFSTWWTSITAAVPATAPSADQSPSAQSGNAQSNNNNNGDQCSESSDCDDDPDPENSSYSDSDQSQSDGTPAPSRPIATAELITEKTNNIIEIGKEAELLDRKQKILDI